MSDLKQLRDDAERLTGRLAEIESALREAGLGWRPALFAGLSLAAFAPQHASAGSLASETMAIKDALKADRQARKIADGQARPALAAALVAAGKPVSALTEAKAALPRRFSAWSGLRPQGAITLAFADKPAPADLEARIESIIEASPRRWYFARAIRPLQALTLALRGCDAASALARFERARDGLEAGGMNGSNAVSCAPKIAVFDTDPDTLAANLQSLRQGRKAEKRLRMLPAERRAMLSAAAPDPDSLHAALEPPLQAAWSRKRKISSGPASALAASLALAALGRGTPGAAASDLMAIIAAEQAATIAAVSAASTAAVSSGS